MKTDKIYDENGRGFTRSFGEDIVEQVNPIKYYKSHELKKRVVLLQDLLTMKNPFLASILSDDVYINQANKMLEGFFEKFENHKIHNNFLQLLNTERKKDQLALVKGMTISTNELMALIFKSYSDYEFLYSRYTFENLPSGLEGKQLPKLFHLKEDGTIHKVGETNMTDGELKNIIEHRKVIVSHILEKGDLWHCFFLTYNSLGGKENYKEGQAHYISSSFGISKADFIESMRSGNYKSTSLHIDLIDYGHQTASAQNK